MENVTEQNTAVPRNMVFLLHSGIHIAAAESEVGVGGIGAGVEVGGSYETPTYAVGFGVRRTIVSAFFLTAVEVLSTSIGGRVSLNTDISPYIGGGLSMNYIQGATVFDEGVESLTQPGVYGVVGIEVPHFSKYRFKLEVRVDKTPDLISRTFGAFFSTTIF